MGIAGARYVPKDQTGAGWFFTLMGTDSSGWIKEGKPCSSRCNDTKQGLVDYTVENDAGDGSRQFARHAGIIGDLRTCRP